MIDLSSHINVCDHLVRSGISNVSGLGNDGWSIGCISETYCYWPAPALSFANSNIARNAHDSSDSFSAYDETTFYWTI